MVLKSRLPEHIEEELNLKAAGSHTHSAYIEDAPSNGSEYVRKDGVWAVATGGAGSGVEEAPEDGTPYARQDADWVAVSSGGGNATMSFGAITTTASSSNSVWSSVTGSDVTVTAGKTYRIRWKLRTYSAANTTGIGLRRVLATAVGTVYGWHARGHSNAVAVIARASREGTVDEFISTGNATSTTNASGSYEVEVLFSCTTTGTLGLEMRSEVNASAATIDGDGSYWVAEEWDT